MIEINDELLRGWPLPKPDQGGDKEERGRVLIVAGAPGMPGAAVLAALASLRAGAGKVRVATCESAVPLVAAAVLEGRILALPETKAGGLAPAAADTILEEAQETDAVLIGPGLVDEEATTRLLGRLLPELLGKPLLLDAGALTALAQVGGRPADLGERTLITPHAEEMAALLRRDAADVTQDPAAAAAEAGERLGGNIVLKGARTLVRLTGGEQYCNRAGTVGLATGGSGDALAGLMAGLLARGAAPGQAAVWAVLIHARAGERLAERIGRLGFLARELLPEFPGLLSELEDGA